MHVWGINIFRITIESEYSHVFFFYSGQYEPTLRDSLATSYAAYYAFPYALVLFAFGNDFLTRGNITTAK